MVKRSASPLPLTANESKTPPSNANSQERGVGFFHDTSARFRGVRSPRTASVKGCVSSAVNVMPLNDAIIRFRKTPIPSSPRVSASDMRRFPIFSDMTESLLNCRIKMPTIITIYAKRSPSDFRTKFLYIADSVPNGARNCNGCNFCSFLCIIYEKTVRNTR